MFSIFRFFSCLFLCAMMCDGCVSCWILWCTWWSWSTVSVLRWDWSYTCKTVFGQVIKTFISLVRKTTVLKRNFHSLPPPSPSFIRLVNSTSLYCVRCSFLFHFFLLAIFSFCSHTIRLSVVDSYFLIMYHPPPHLLVCARVGWNIISSSWNWYKWLKMAKIV